MKKNSLDDLHKYLFSLMVKEMGKAKIIELIQSFIVEEKKFSKKKKFEEKTEPKPSKMDTDTDKDKRKTERFS